MSAPSTGEGASSGPQPAAGPPGREQPTVERRSVRGLAVDRRRADGGGAAPVVVFVHGSMDRGASFGKTTRRLPDLDVVRYDRRGYGRSSGLEPAVDLDEQVDDLLAVIEDARAEGTLGPAIVIGHSLGGVIALAAAVRRPDLITAVGAFESPLAWMSWWPKRSAGGDAVNASRAGGPESAAERFMRRMIGDERWERLPSRTRDERRAEGPALVADLTGVRRQDAPFDLAGVDVPVVAGRGGDSVDHHRRTAQELAEAVPGAELWEIDGCAHGAHLTHPDAFAAFVRRVVERADTSSGSGPSSGRSSGSTPSSGLTPRRPR